MLPVPWFVAKAIWAVPSCGGRARTERLGTARIVSVTKQRAGSADSRLYPGQWIRTSVGPLKSNPPRHTQLKFAEEVLNSSPPSRTTRPNVAGFGDILTALGQLRHIRPISSIRTKFSLIWAKARPKLTYFGQVWQSFVEIWQMLVHIDQNGVNVGRIFAEIGHRPNLVGLLSKLAHIGQNLAQTGHASAGICLPNKGTLVSQRHALRCSTSAASRALS